MTPLYYVIASGHIVVGCRTTKELAIELGIEYVHKKPTYTVIIAEATDRLKVAKPVIEHDKLKEVGVWQP